MRKFLARSQAHPVHNFMQKAGRGLILFSFTFSSTLFFFVLNNMHFNGLHICNIQLEQRHGQGKRLIASFDHGTAALASSLKIWAVMYAPLGAAMLDIFQVVSSGQLSTLACQSGWLNRSRNARLAIPLQYNTLPIVVSLSAGYLTSAQRNRRSTYMYITSTDQRVIAPLHCATVSNHYAMDTRPLFFAP